MRNFLIPAACLTLAAAAPTALIAPAEAWSAHGHRTITLLALDVLPADMPEWLRDPEIRKRIADQSNEPDRWRGTSSVILAHENDPEHYIDVEDLANFGLTLETVSPFRGEYLRALIIAKHTHPEMAGEYDASRDPEHTKEWPGFVLHSMAEHQVKLRSSFNTYRILMSLNEPERQFQLNSAKENCLYHIGVLSHYVGDAAQPLHTTRHHHGWAGPNPEGYTIDRGFHSYIDGAIVSHHRLSFETLRPLMPTADKMRHIDGKEPWPEILAHVQRSFATVEPLYKLQKSGDLQKEAGKELIAARMVDGATMLAALIESAWKASEPTEKDIQNWVRYSGMGASTRRPPRDGAPEPTPAEPTPTPTPKETGGP